MYKYVEDKEFLTKARGLCGEIMQNLCHRLNKEYDIGANFFLVGSGGRNLITQNENRPVDLDYNLEITRCYDYEDYRVIKESVRKAFNETLNEYGWSDCQDSTSALTTELRHFTKGNSTEFSMDVCIVTQGTDDQYYRLIHEKTGLINCDRYHWDKAPCSHKICKKVRFIKNKGKWLLVREQYLKIKNRYLRGNDHNHPSFICYIEAVNNVYNHIK